MADAGKDLSCITPPDISVLSPELLVKIFTHLQDLHNVEAARMMISTGDSIRLRWSTVSHVCQYWRQIALGTPTLWSHIPLENSFWLEESLKRSHPVPISIDYHSLGGHPYDRLHLALQQLHRVTDLSMSSTFLDLGSPLFLQPAPMLRKLSLSSVFQCKVPPNLFDSHFPELRSLRVDNIIISQESALFSASLRELNIHPCVGTRLDDIASALSKMSCLEVLHLRGVPRDNNVGGIDDARRSYLPLLRKLTIADGDFTSTLALLSLLKLPRLDTISLLSYANAGSFGRRQDENNRNSISEVFDHLHIYETSTYASLRFEHLGESHSTSFRAWDTSRMQRAGKDDDPQVSIRIHSYRLLDTDLDSFSRLNAQHIQDLFVDVRNVEPPPISFPFSHFAQSQRLVLMAFTSSLATSLLHFLLADISPVGQQKTLTEESPTSLPLAFPALEGLVLFGAEVTFEEAGNLPYMFRLRAERGSPLKLMCFRGCTVSEEIVLELEEVIELVEVDW